MATKAKIKLTKRQLRDFINRVDRRRGALGLSVDQMADKGGFGKRTYEQAKKTGEFSHELYGGIHSALDLEEATRPTLQNWLKLDQSRKGSIFAAAFVVAVVSLVLGFGLYPSEQERALRALSAQNIPLNSESTTSKLAAGDTATLNLMTKAGLSLKELEAGLRVAHRSFFDNTIGDDSAVEWLKSQIAAGLDPEMRVDDEKYEQVALLFSAIESGNADMSIALIEAGASPYPYQDLYYVHSRLPLFLFPVHGVFAADVFPQEDKERLVATMLSHGIKLTKPAFSNDVVLYGRSKEWWREDVARLLQEADEENLPEELSDQRHPTPPHLNFERDTTLCMIASKRDEKDWCGFANTFPYILVGQDRSETNIPVVFIQEPISFNQDRVYFETLIWDGYFRFGALEVMPDRDHWKIYRHATGDIHRSGVKSECSLDNFPSCFREFSMERISANLAKQSLSDFRVIGPEARGETIVLPNEEGQRN